MRFPGSEQDYRYTRNHFINTDTKWVRMWVYWPELQPVSGYQPGVDPPGYTSNPPGRPPSFLLSNLDAQISQANADGRLVILTIYGFPTWTNSQNRATYAGQKQGKSDTMCFPDTLDTNSPWAALVWFLLMRYAVQTRNPHIQGLEIVNEPNAQCWPQQNGSGSQVAACLVGQMFQTASACNLYAGRQVFLMGPATLDLRGNSATRTDFLDFTASLTSNLQSYNFSDPTFFWTHHPYAETQNPAGAAQPGPLPTAQLRNSLVGKWKGYGGDPNHPYIFITETGVQRPAGGGINNSEQANRLAYHMAVLRNDNYNQGLDIGMFTNYLFYTDYGFDTGLLENPSVGGAPRTAYTTPWTTYIPGLY